MSEAPQSSNPATNPAVQSSESVPPTPVRCIGGSIVAAGIAVLLYMLTSSIAHTFAAKGIHSDNFTAQRIAAAVRTLVIGLSALGTGIFGLAAVGLLGLGVQLLVQRFRGESVPPANS